MAVITLKSSNKASNCNNIRLPKTKGAGSVFIYTYVNNKVYVLLGLEYNGEYNIALGKRDGNETFVDAASRELNEEMHIYISPEDLKSYPYWIDVQKLNNKIHNVVLLYFVYLPIFIPATYFTKSINPDDKLTMLDYIWVPLDLLLTSNTRVVTLNCGKVIKLRRYLKSLLKLFVKKHLNSLLV